jgi:hypothetical protein
VDEGWGSNLKAQTSSTIYIGVLLMDWAIAQGKDHGFEVPYEDRHKLGKAHCEVWKTRGVFADPYNLKRAKEEYEEAVKKMNNASDVNVWVEFSRLLQYTGELKYASKIMMRVLSSFSNHEDFATFLLYAGGMLKALGKYPLIHPSIS